ncbi:MAG: hypothetical protein IKK22_06135, partial [Firmicutes bacterium]|nr:hypothetical protein [Bacillota bacterium]
MGYCEVSIAGLSDMIHNELVIEIRASDWSRATASFDAFDSRWHQAKRLYSLFLTELALKERLLELGVPHPDQILIAYTDEK